MISGSNERRLGSEGVVKKYRVQLTEEEREEIRGLVTRGRPPGHGTPMPSVPPAPTHSA